MYSKFDRENPLPNSAVSRSANSLRTCFPYSALAAPCCSWFTIRRPISKLVRTCKVSTLRTAALRASRMSSRISEKSVSTRFNPPPDFCIILFLLAIAQLPQVRSDECRFCCHFFISGAVHLSRGKSILHLHLKYPVHAKVTLFVARRARSPPAQTTPARACNTPGTRGRNSHVSWKFTYLTVCWDFLKMKFKKKKTNLRFQHITRFPIWHRDCS